MSAGGGRPPVPPEPGPSAPGLSAPGQECALPAAADLLRQEYFKVQDMIEAFDERALQIKGWSVTVSLAGMGASLIAKDVTAFDKALAAGLSAVAALAFWSIEYYWKCFQWTMMERNDRIEAFFRDPTIALHPLQINENFQRNHGAVVRRSASRLVRPFLMFPHGPIALLGLVLAAIHLLH